MAWYSVYMFDQTDLRGNWQSTNTLEEFDQFGESAQNTQSGSELTIHREGRELLIDLYARFNSPDFLALLDITPLINGVTTNANPNALMVLISSAMSHYGYRTSDIRAGWDQWRHVPYHEKDSNRHPDDTLLNQIAFNFHIDRGVGTVDNDGWIAFYFLFELDNDKLHAYVDWWAYQYGGGEGLPDDGQDLSAVLDSVLPSFTPTLQTFLDSFCSAAFYFSGGVRDSQGNPLFDRQYLVPGDGGSPFMGLYNFSEKSRRPIDAEVSLAVLPKQKEPITPDLSGPVEIAQDVANTLKAQGWNIQASEVRGTCNLKGSRISNGRSVEIDVRLKQTLTERSNASGVERKTKKQVKPAPKKKKGSK